MSAAEEIRRELMYRRRLAEHRPGLGRGNDPVRGRDGAAGGAGAAVGGNPSLIVNRHRNQNDQESKY